MTDSFRRWRGTCQQRFRRTPGSGSRRPSEKERRLAPRAGSSERGIPGDPDRSTGTSRHRSVAMAGIVGRSWRLQTAARAAGLEARPDDACPDRRTGGTRRSGGSRRGASLRQEGRPNVRGPSEPTGQLRPDVKESRARRRECRFDPRPYRSTKRGSRRT